MIEGVWRCGNCAMLNGESNEHCWKCAKRGPVRVWQREGTYKTTLDQFV